MIASVANWRSAHDFSAKCGDRMITEVQRVLIIVGLLILAAFQRFLGSR
jgi:hypothetical protein